MKLHLDAFARGPGAVLVAAGLLASVVFGPNGLDPRTVPEVLAPGSLARAATLGVLVVLLRGHRRAIVFPPGATWLRASAVPRAAQIAAVLACGLLAASPLPIVFVVGRAPLDALVVALAITCAGLSSSAIGAVFGLALGIVRAPSAIVLPLQIVVTGWVLVRALRDAPIVRPRLGLRLRAWPWPLQVALAVIRSLARDGLGLVALAACAPLVGVLLVGVADRASRAGRALSLAASVALLGASPIAAKVERVARAIRPIVRASARPRRAPFVVAIAILATPSFAYAAGTHAAAPPLPTAAVGLATVAAFVAIVSRVAARRRDAALVSVLLAIPLVAGVTLLASGSPSTALATSLVVLAVVWFLPEPEVPRALDR